jgi:hypothetical protein
MRRREVNLLEKKKQGGQAGSIFVYALKKS